jgi:hypothetical protein
MNSPGNFSFLLPKFPRQSNPEPDHYYQDAVDKINFNNNKLQSPAHNDDDSKSERIGFYQGK